MKEDKLKRLFRWILENLETWCIICGIDNNETSQEQYINIKIQLEREEFYELLWVLYTCQNDVATPLDRIMKEEHNHIARFIDENMDTWLTICGVGEYPISADKYRHLSLLLSDKKFEELKIVLFTIHGYAIKDQYKDTLISIKKQCEIEIVRRNNEEK